MLTVMTSAHRRHTYDHRVRALVQRTGDANLMPELSIPRSTARSWVRRGSRPVLSLDVVDMNVLELQREVLQLRRRVGTLTSIIRLLLAILRVSGFRLDETRLPEEQDKARLLRVIGNARQFLSLSAVFKVLRLSAARYHAWARAEVACELDDRSSCPRTKPQGLTPGEVSIIRAMTTDEQFRHMPLGVLARFAQRIGRVFASASTWARLIREHGWRRPRRRLYPVKPKTGLRASRPNEYLHLDVTVLKLIDGTKVYLHAVIDNFSRRILAWRVAERLDPTTTCEVLCEAAEKAGLIEPLPVMTDGGIENINGKVDALVMAGLIRRILAQVEISFSNSMIEAWWRSLRHQWLYLNSLDSVGTVRRLVEFYVAQHNEVMPHSAFKGQTPDEMYFGRAGDLPEQLAGARARAREERLRTNRSLSCGACQSRHALN